jgi:hypothetical protein
VRLRGHLNSFGKRNRWPSRVDRLREILNEAHGRARHERELDPAPVRGAHVVHDGPALKQGFLPFLESQSIGRLPDGRLGRVAHLERARARAEGLDLETPHVPLVSGAKEIEVARHLRESSASRRRIAAAEPSSTAHLPGA